MSGIKKLGKSVLQGLSGGSSGAKKRKSVPNPNPSHPSTTTPSVANTETNDEIDEMLNAELESQEEQYEDAPEHTSEHARHNSQETVESQTQRRGGGGRKGSWVWAYFTKILVPDSGGKRSTATCDVCKDAGIDCTYNLKTNDGTGTLMRHLNSKHRITEAGIMGQSSGGHQTQLHGFNPGGGTPFSYNSDRMVDMFSKYVILDELPFNHGESQNLEEYNRLALQPQYKRVPRNTVKRHALKQFAMQRGQLFNTFKEFDGKISLTSDCWTSPVNEPFICVTAHWIDDDWLLQKRIIAFQAMHDSHNGYNIKTRILDVCNSYGISQKIFSISFDNASANTKAIDYFIDDDNFPKLVNGKLFHVRCCAHVLNLSAQKGISQMEPLINPIRHLAKWIRARMDIKREFRELCKQRGLKPKKLRLDTPTRWNSTWELIAPAIQYKQILSQLYNSRVDPEDMITSHQWDVCEKICGILEKYETSTKVFSLVYDPNVHRVILQASLIAHAIGQGVEVPEISIICEKMKKKWLKYMKDIPLLYSLATVLDPNIKFIHLENMLNFYYTSLGYSYDIDSYVQQVRELLEELYRHYASIYAHDQPVNPENTLAKLYDPIFSSSMFRRKGKAPASSSSGEYQEIDDYINFTFEVSNEFDILQFWNTKQHKFPILSRIAKDILAIQASTIASESAFSAGRRVIDDRRTRLSPESIELCVCKRDWDMAEKRTQHLKYEETKLDSPETENTTASDNTDDE